MKQIYLYPQSEWPLYRQYMVDNKQVYFKIRGMTFIKIQDAIDTVYANIDRYVFTGGPWYEEI